MNLQFLAILFLLILISILLISILLLILYFIFKKKIGTKIEKETFDQKRHHEGECEKKELSINPSSSLTTCHTHPNDPAVGICAICKKSLCEKCVREEDKIIFCPEHFQTYLSTDWVEVAFVTTTPDLPEKGLFIYQFQEKNWQESQTPTFIVTHYKINVESDHIESHIKLMAKKTDSESLLKVLTSSHELKANNPSLSSVK